MQGEVSWNFNKFLIAKDGHLTARFGSRTEPSSKELIEKIESLLAA